jgi:hypothetical protein
VTRPRYADRAYVDPRESKKNQGIPNKKGLGFPWNPLAETGLFNELQPKKIKKFSPLHVGGS